jgi:hypothetical protein
MHTQRKGGASCFLYSGIGIVVILFLISGRNITAESVTQSVTDTPCDLHRGPCIRPLSGGEGTVTLDVLPKPVRAMIDLVFSVQVAGVSPKDAPYIDLGMPGMTMGPNRVSLKKSDNGVFTGSGIIVRCPSGKTLWQMTVTVPGTGTAEFFINAVY